MPTPSTVWSECMATNYGHNLQGYDYAGSQGFYKMEGLLEDMVVSYPPVHGKGSGCEDMLTRLQIEMTLAMAEYFFCWSSFLDFFT